MNKKKVIEFLMNLSLMEIIVIIIIISLFCLKSLGYLESEEDNRITPVYIPALPR